MAGLSAFSMTKRTSGGKDIREADAESPASASRSFSFLIVESIRAPRPLSSVMTVNKPVMSEEPLWVAASRNK
jgi:hypothetical protein